jgi:hypothetical protein
MNLRNKSALRFLIVTLLAIALPACNSGPSDAECESAWSQMEIGVDPLEYDTYDEYVEAFETEVGMTVSMALNREHAPDSVGYVLKECIQNGWDYRAASGID